MTDSARLRLPYEPAGGRDSHTDIETADAPPTETAARATARRRVRRREMRHRDESPAGVS